MSSSLNIPLLVLTNIITQEDTDSLNKTGNKQVIADTSVDIETSESRHDASYRQASPSSSSSPRSRKESSSRKDHKNDDQYNPREGQRHPSKLYGQPAPLLGYEYEEENEDPFAEAREIGAQQYALLTGEENHIEAPPRYQDDEVTSPPQESRVQRHENRKKTRYSKRTTRRKNGPREEVTTRILAPQTSPSRQEHTLQRYPDYMMDQDGYSMLPDYYQGEHIPQADDSGAYFDDGHQDYDGDPRIVDHDFDDGYHSPEDHSDEDHQHSDHNQDHDDSHGHDSEGHEDGHHDDAHDHEEGKDNESESTESHTLTLTGKDNIPSDMRFPYDREEVDPREEEADAFLRDREREAEHMLFALKAQERM
jgi:hypothetical protein